MLEKSRLVHLRPQQNSFSIFYLMAEGLSAEESSALYLSNVLAHRYTRCYHHQTGGLVLDFKAMCLCCIYALESLPNCEAQAGLVFHFQPNSPWNLNLNLLLRVFVSLHQISQWRPSRGKPSSRQSLDPEQGTPGSSQTGPSSTGLQQTGIQRGQVRWGKKRFWQLADDGNLKKIYAKSILNEEVPHTELTASCRVCAVLHFVVVMYVNLPFLNS